MSILKGIPFLRQELTKIFMKRAADKSGIMQIPFKNKKLQLDIEERLQKYILDAEKQGVDLDMVSNQNLKYTIKLNENTDPISRIISADSEQGRRITNMLLGKRGEVVDMTGKKLDTSQGIMGGKSVKELMESGQVQKGTEGLKKSKKVQDREMFENSNLNKTDAQIKAEIEASNKKSLSKMETNNFSLNTITKIKSMKPMDAMKEANLVAGKKGRYANLDDNQVKKIIDDTTDHIFERDIPIDPEDMAGGGVAGLLGERPRQNFKMGKRAFLKLLGSGFAGIAGLKSGLLGFGKKEAAKKAVTETVKQAAGSGTPPPYFFKLVEKIKTLGDDTLATQDKVIAKKYKDYTMEEDFAGNIEIMKKGDDVAEDVYMSYKVDDVPVKGKKGSTKVEEYEEYTARPDAEGKMKDVEPGVPDEVVNEGSVFEDNMTEFGMTKKADGGRIGFDSGGSPLQRLRQSLVDDLMYKFPSMKEEDMQMIVKDINLGMSTEEAQASMSENFTKVFGKSGMFSTGGIARMLGE